MATIRPVVLSLHYDKIGNPERPWRLKISYIEQETPKWVEELMHLAFATFVDALAEILIRWALGAPISLPKAWASEVGDVHEFATWLLDKFPEGDLGPDFIAP